MKRLFDILFSSILLLIFILPILIISLFIKIASKGPVFYITDRIGIQNKIFKMYKFRTMKIDTPPVATHLLEHPDRFLIPFGRFLRKTSLDELPQLFNILKGDMGFVGPRPALYNQDDLISLRTQKKIHLLKPGLTGWAQISGRDNISIPEKVELDEFYFRNQSFLFDIKILCKTLFKVVRCEGIDH